MKKTLVISAIAAAILSGCFNEQTGELSLNITDAAVTDADSVTLSVAGVTIKGPNGQQKFQFLGDDNEPEAKDIELLSLAGSESLALVEDWTLPAGEYQWIRLDVNTAEDGDSFVMIGDTPHELTIPSDELKLVSGFTIPANGSADFTVDVDLYKGLVFANNKYKLKPTMRLIDNATAGHIEGTVDGQIFTNENCLSIAVYAFAGDGVDADDVFNDEGPELVAWVDTETSPYTYSLGFLTQGDYTLHLACDPDDDPEVDDNVDFIVSQTQTVAVTDKQTVTADFAP